MTKRYYNILIKPEIPTTFHCTKALAFGVFDEDETLAMMRAVDASYTKERLIKSTIKLEKEVEENSDE
jgi:hypothetical protein